MTGYNSAYQTTGSNYTYICSNAMHIKTQTYSGINQTKDIHAKPKERDLSITIALSISVLIAIAILFISCKNLYNHLNG